MRKALSPAAAVLYGFALLLGLSAPRVHAQEKPDDGHRSPRATVRTLLTSITVARAHPQLIKNAVSCLDLSGLPADQKDSAALLATRLEAVLRARDVDTEILPDQVDGDVYVFTEGQGSRVALRKMNDGRWLFDRETVAQIPKLYAEAQKQLQDKNREAASIHVSPDYASARATVRTVVNGYRRQDFKRILASMDLSDIPSAAREEVGRQLANKLKQIIVRHPRVILQEIPDSNYSDPYVLLSSPQGAVELVRIPSGNRKGEWVFSRDTVNAIDKLYVAVEDRPYDEAIVASGTLAYLPTPWGETEMWLRSLLPGWLRASVVSAPRFSLQVYELLGYVLIPALAFGLYRLTTWLLAALVHGVLARRGWALPRETVVRRLRPAGLFVGVLFLRWALLGLGPDRVLLTPLLVVLNPLVWLLGMWAIFRGIDLIGDLLELHLTAEKKRPEITQMLWPVGSLLLKIILLVGTLFHLMALFSWDVTAVLTGLGIGGLAFALGAQDSLKNLFGSFTLIADRPFVVGESVKIGNHEVGVVEVVGLRSTRIRTADDTLLIVPNSNLTTTEITNYGRRRYRRYQTRLGVAYSTPPEKLIAFRDGVKELIRKQERTRKDHFEVAVNEMTASAVEILVNVYFEAADRQQELAARDALILEILRLAEELNVDLAYPTQTIHLVAPPELEGQTRSLLPATDRLS
jgi:MscS family membrane protein